MISALLALFCNMTKLGLATISKQNNLFQILFQNVNVFMFYFESNFIEKFLWESDFSNFGHVTKWAKRKFVF